MRCYDIAHHIGLSLKEEYELLGLFDERQRQEYLKRHLAKVIPTVAGMEQLKEKIKLNGHFKDLPGFNYINTSPRQCPLHSVLILVIPAEKSLFLKATEIEKSLY